MQQEHSKSVVLGVTRYTKAVWAPPGYDSLGAFTSGPLKAVWHRTQGATYVGAWATYRKKRVCPHFTIDTDGTTYQHFDTSVASYSLANEPEGVQTNRDSAIQVEVVGFSGETMPDKQRNGVLRLMAWLEGQGVPWRWPMGQPPKNSTTGYGKDTPYRDARVWDTVGGHYGHSNVPENEHWDPAWTGGDWNALRAKPTATPQSTPSGVCEVQLPVLRSGSHGGAVRSLQSLLKTKAGQDIDATGTFGTVTDRCVRNVQRYFGLEEDGIVGSSTWGVLFL
mgnify:CR=1 FL=1